MHHNIELAVPAEATPDTLAMLGDLDGVVQLSVEHGASVKPSGDVVRAQVLNREIDAVLAIAGKASQFGSVSVTSSEAHSMLSEHSPSAIASDGDEAPVERIERGLRHNGSLSWNYSTLMGLGGGITVAGLLSSPVSQALALAAASFIAPAFHALARTGLAVVELSWNPVRRGLVGAAGGFLVLAVVSALVYLLLHAVGAATPEALAASSGVRNVAHPTAADWVVTVFGAAAGVIIVSAFRAVVIGGALIAIGVVPAAAVVGAGLAAGDMVMTLEALRRFIIDALLVVGLSAAILLLKQHLMHGNRRPFA